MIPKNVVEQWDTETLQDEAEDWNKLADERWTPKQLKDEAIQICLWMWRILEQK